MIVATFASFTQLVDPRRQTLSGLIVNIFAEFAVLLQSPESPCVLSLHHVVMKALSDYFLLLLESLLKVFWAHDKVLERLHLCVTDIRIWCPILFRA